MVLVPLGILFHGVPWPALAKFLVVAPLAIVAAYPLACGLRLIRPVRATLG